MATPAEAPPSSSTPREEASGERPRQDTEEPPQARRRKLHTGWSIFLEDIYLFWELPPEDGHLYAEYCQMSNAQKAWYRERAAGLSASRSRPQRRPQRHM